MSIKNLPVVEEVPGSAGLQVPVENIGLRADGADVHTGEDVTDILDITKFEDTLTEAEVVLSQRQVSAAAIRGLIERLSQGEERIDGFVESSEEAIARSEEERSLVRGLAEEVGQQVDLSEQERREDRLHEQIDIVDKLRARVVQALDNSHQRLETMERDYARFCEFIGVMRAAANVEDNPFVDFMACFDGLSFDAWVEAKIMSHPGDFIAELRKMESASELEKGSGTGSPSQVIARLVDSFSQGQKDLEKRDRTLDEGFVESEEISSLRARLAKVPGSQYEELKKAVEANILNKVAKEKRVYVEGRKQEVDQSRRELDAQFYDDVRTFAKGNLLHLFLANLIEDRGVKMDDLCKDVADGIGLKNRDFPYFLLPAGVVAKLVEDLSITDIREMFEVRHPLVFTRQFEERAKGFGLDGIDLFNLGQGRANLDSYLAMRRELIARVYRFEERMRAYKADVTGEVERIQKVLTVPFVYDQTDGELAGLDSEGLSDHLSDLKRAKASLDEIVAGVEALKDYGKQFVAKFGYDEVDCNLELIGEYNHIVGMLDEMAALAPKVVAKRSESDCLPENMDRANAALRQAFGASVNSRKFLESHQHLHMGDHIHDKVQHLERFRERLEVEIKCCGWKEKIDALKVELGGLLLTVMGNIREAHGRSALLRHQQGRLERLQDGGGVGLWGRKIAVCIHFDVSVEDDIDRDIADWQNGVSERIVFTRDEKFTAAKLKKEISHRKNMLYSSLAVLRLQLGELKPLDLALQEVVNQIDSSGRRGLVDKLLGNGRSWSDLCDLRLRVERISGLVAELIGGDGV